MVFSIVGCTSMLDYHVLKSINPYLDAELPGRPYCRYYRILDAVPTISVSPRPTWWLLAWQADKINAKHANCVLTISGQGERGRERAGSDEATVKKNPSCPNSTTTPRLRLPDVRSNLRSSVSFAAAFSVKPMTSGPAVGI